MVQSLLLILAVFASTCFAQVEVNPETNLSSYVGHQVRDGRISTIRTVLPFELYAGYLIVFEGRIGSRNGLKFLLDTGATRSMLNRKLANKLGLARTQGPVAYFDRIVTTERATVPDIQFGQVRVADCSMLVGDLTVLEATVDHVDAVIGLDILRTTSFGIDYDSKKLEFGHRESAVSFTPLNSTPRVLAVETKIGDATVRLVVDTGMTGVLLYEDRLKGRIPKLKIESTPARRSVAGQLHLSQATVSQLQIGSTELDRTVWVLKGPAESVLPSIDGYIGTNALKARRVDFNFEERTLNWKR